MATCSFSGCSMPAGPNGFCFRHRIYAGAKGKPPGKAASPAQPSKPAKPVEKKAPRQKPVKKKSKKLARDERQYRKIVARKLAEDPTCEIRSPDCTGAAEGLHHTKGRGKLLLDEKYLKRACNACNGYVERHPLWAIENGHSVSRHIKAK